MGTGVTGTVLCLLMQPHDGERPPDPKERERQRQWVLTHWLMLVIGVLLGVLTPMLLKRFFF